MLRIAVQSKGRLYDDTMSLLEEADIKVNPSKRTLLVQSTNFPLEVLFLRDDDIPQSVASGVADIGIVGENEFLEREEKAEIVKRITRGFYPGAWWGASPPIRVFLVIIISWCPPPAGAAAPPLDSRRSGEGCSPSPENPSSFRLPPWTIRMFFPGSLLYVIGLLYLEY